MGKIFDLEAGERTRVLWIFSSSIPGQTRFRVETPDGKVLKTARVSAGYSGEADTTYWGGIGASQLEDGSWSNEADRWMEGHPVLTTAYAMLALQAAMN